MNHQFPAVEITFSTAATEQSIALLRKQFPKMTIAAGTVLTSEQAQQAHDTGADFVISPDFNPKVVEYCLQ
ncbi:Putative KHG/KDPG aldolase [Suttonella ornithocola]|uniref:KHG/KDPG aldolase n=2 Tax=Suttonella ornithocola TaxID=279832 RepID=A0A380MST8_9GAMM|nr:Putative KHG/KDPG aldolase [Suttonella ornithocola]